MTGLIQTNLFDVRFEKFGFITDTHYDYKYDSRKDNTLSTLLNKTEQCYAEFKRKNCSFVIHGGDVFDRHRIYNFDLIRGVRNIMMGSGIPTYFILGQHDAQGYNKATLDKSNLGFISDICDGSLLFIDDFIETNDYIVYASHVSVDCVKRVNSIGEHKKPVICVAHALLTDKREAFGTISISHIKNPNVQLVLSGDLHDGISLQTKNDIQFYNPGALARTEKGTRMPKVGVLQYNGKEFTCEEFYPNCPANEDIFFLEEEIKTASIEQNITNVSFIDSFKEFRSETGNAFDLLLNVGRIQNVNKDILEMIKTYKDMKEDYK